MTLNERIDVLVRLGSILGKQNDPSIQSLIQRACVQNPWFTPGSVGQALSSVAHQYLDRKKLENWVANYPVDQLDSRTIGLVLAGNLPMVGFHDLLCSFIAGHKSEIKCSSKDNVLIPGILQMMGDIDQNCLPYFWETDRLKNFDAVIATGGETAAVHFEYYFAKYPHIIRKNRNSVAVLSGEESAEELQGLAHDIFDYFGLGCRSISKIFIPMDYDTDVLFGSFLPFSDVIHHHKYKINYDYNHAIYLLGKDSFLTNGFLIVREDSAIASRIACLHYERYRHMKEVEHAIGEHRDSIQCVAGHIESAAFNALPLGTCQNPGLDDYADDVDTLSFMCSLN